MKIQYMSDLHLEFGENSRYLKHNELPVTGDCWFWLEIYSILGIGLLLW